MLEVIRDRSLGISAATVGIGVVAGYAISLPGSALLVAATIVLLVAFCALAPAVRRPTPLEGRVDEVDPLVKFLLGLGILGLGAYQLAFNYVGTGERLQAAGAVSLVLSVTGLWVALGAGSRRVGWVLVGLVGVLVAVSVAGAMVSLHAVEVTTFFRQTFPFLLACGVLARPSVVPRRLVGMVASAVVLIGTAISYGNGNRVLQNVYRAAPFTGGAVDGAHASAYVLAVCGILVNELRRQRVISPLLAIPVVAISIVGVVGLRVATAMVVLLVYYLFRLMMDHRSIAVRSLIVAVAVVALGAGYQLRVQEKTAVPKAAGTSLTLNRLSSGRLDAWSARLGVLDTRSAQQLFLGTGIGSDNISTAAWQGAVKNSHNDYLSLIINEGILGLAAYVVFFVIAGRSVGAQSLPIIAAVLVSGGLSNALLYSRPTIMPFAWLAIAITAGSLRVDPRRGATIPKPGDARGGREAAASGSRDLAESIPR